MKRPLTLERISAAARRRLGWPRGVVIGRNTWLHSTVRAEGEGIQIGDHCRLRRGVLLKGPRVTLGHRVFCNDGVYIDQDVTIEDEVRLGPFVRLISGTHEIGCADNRAGDTVTDPVRIGRGSWIGAGATVLPGVAVGAGCVIAAGAVVTTDCAPHGLYAGVPAVRKRDLPR